MVIDHWGIVKVRFDDEISTFIAAVEMTRSEAARTGGVEEAWPAYLERQQALREAIDGVVALIPETASERRARHDVAGQLMGLCHSLDETWLEFQAERISPAYAELARVFEG